MKKTTAIIFLIISNFFFKKLVPLVIEFPFIEFERCFKKLFATLGEKITGIFDVFIFFGLSFLTANSPAFSPTKEAFVKALGIGFRKNINFFI